MRRSIFVVAAVLLLLFGMNANATPISFMETGTASGYYFGTAFSNASFVITATGDTSLAHWDPWLSGTGAQIDLITASVRINDFAPVSLPANYLQFMVLNQARTLFLNVIGDDRFTALSGPVSDSFAEWDMTTSIGPIVGDATGVLRYPRLSNLSQFYMSVDGPVTFTATVADSAAIPEPGTLALVGAGAFALAVYRKRMKKA